MTKQFVLHLQVITMSALHLQESCTLFKPEFKKYFSRLPTLFQRDLFSFLVIRY